jgi:hypothetical protein
MESAFERYFIIEKTGNCRSDHYLMKTIAVISVFMASVLTAHSQAAATVEQYYFTPVAGSQGTVTPMANFTTSNNWYGEARYNFDELNTFSMYAGRKFTGRGSLSWEATPMVGGLLGQMTGGSVGVNVGMDYKKMFFASQSQYSFSVENNTDRYFYNWTELGYNATKWLYAGLALQQTNIYKAIGQLEPGCMIGFSVRNWTIPLYAFNTGNQETYFVLGVNWQWEGRKKKSKNEQVLTAEPNNYSYE